MWTLGTPSRGLNSHPLTTGAHRGAVGHPALIDGDPGVLVMVGGRPVLVMAFTVTGGAITVIRMLADPGRLAQAVPSWVA